MSKKHETKVYNMSEFVELMAEKAEGASKKETEKFLKAFIEATKDICAAGDAVRFIGFGAFAQKEYAARKGRNPQTGETLDIPAHKALVFRASSKLRF